MAHVKQPESRLVNRIRAYLEGEGAWTFKVHGGDNPFQEVGIPDVLFCLRGRFGALEVKLPGEVASPRQLHVLKEIKKAGGITAVVDSVEDVVKILARIPRK